MRFHPGLTHRRVLCALSSLALAMVLPPAVAQPAEKEAARIAFTERYRATQHGGIVRAANSSATCGVPVSASAPSCRKAQRGSGGTNGSYRMTYIDVDSDPNTYNSSRAGLAVPRGARVTYARLYWGGNLRVGEQKPPKDNGRVLFAEPGGSYRQIHADSLIGHRRTGVTDGYTASANVTRLVAQAGGGPYTVGQVNVAGGHSPAGAWGGWTLVVAYAHNRAPLRHLRIMDGYESLTPSRKSLTLTLDGLRMPPKASGRLGVVAYNGDRGIGGETLSVRSGRAASLRVRDAANASDDPMNSTIADCGTNSTDRVPSHQHTLGYDSDVYCVSPALARGGSRLSFRFTTADEGYQLGALFLQTDARR